MNDRDLELYVKCFAETVDEYMHEFTTEELVELKAKIDRLVAVVNVAYKDRSGRDIDETVH